MINSLPKFLDSHKILIFSPPEKILFSFGNNTFISGPSIIKFLLEIPLKEASKFSIFIKQFLLLIAETSQLYSPSFSVIAISPQSIPSLDEK